MPTARRFLSKRVCGLYRLQATFIRDLRLGREEELPVPGTTLGKFAADWSSDGKYVMFIAESRIIARSDLWIAPFDPREKPFAFADKPVIVETQVRVSRNAQWVAFTTGDTGRFEVYVEPVHGTAQPQRVSLNGGGWPLWSRKGDVL